MKIVDVRAVTCDVPVPRPIVMGDLRYDTRDYIIVEIITDEGVNGFGFGMSRYAPVAEVVLRNLKPLLIAGGYVAADKDLRSLGDEVADYVARGFRKIKISAGPLEEDTARIKVAREAAGDAELMYDA